MLDAAYEKATAASWSLEELSLDADNPVHAEARVSL
jgi:hypothetical protein